MVRHILLIWTVLKGLSIWDRETIVQVCAWKNVSSKPQKINPAIVCWIWLLGMHWTGVKYGKCSSLFAETLCEAYCKGKKKYFGGKKEKENQGVDEVEENMQSLNLPGSWIFFLISWYSVSFIWLLILVRADTWKVSELLPGSLWKGWNCLWQRQLEEKGREAVPWEDDNIFF